MDLIAERYDVSRRPVRFIGRMFGNASDPQNAMKIVLLIELPSPLAQAAATETISCLLNVKTVKGFAGAHAHLATEHRGASLWDKNGHRQVSQMFSLRRTLM